VVSPRTIVGIFVRIAILEMGQEQLMPAVSPANAPVGEANSSKDRGNRSTIHFTFDVAHETQIRQSARW